MNNLTFTFSVDPDLNEGYTEAFNQCGEFWWWYCGPDAEGFSIGPTPNFTGAEFKGVYDGSKPLLENNKWIILKNKGYLSPETLEF